MSSLKISLKLLILALVSTSALASAETVQDGKVNLRITDSNIQTQDIYYRTTDNVDKANLFIESEKTDLPGVIRENRVMAYAKTPINFLYYVLELNPKRGNFQGKDLVIREDRGSGRSSCSEDSNALLKSYRGDGTFTISCVTLNPKL